MKIPTQSSAQNAAAPDYTPGRTASAQGATAQEN